MALNIRAFWDAVLRQDAAAIREFFHPNAWVNWNNTNEHFTLEGFIRANCEYPGQWDGEVEQVITTGTHVVTATHVYNKDGSISCHVASFIRVVDGKSHPWTNTGVTTARLRSGGRKSTSEATLENKRTQRLTGPARKNLWCELHGRQNTKRLRIIKKHL